jgi:hypothetical protein
MVYDLDIRKTCLWAPVHNGHGLEAALLKPVRDWLEQNLPTYTLVGERHLHPSAPFETVIRFTSEADLWQFKLRWFGIDNPRDL